MKYLLILILGAFFGCSQEVPSTLSHKVKTRTAEAVSVSKTNAALPGITIINWGPQSAVQGENPNRQPDGGVGIWIQIRGSNTLIDPKVVFDGQPAITITQGKLITASVNSSHIKDVGKKTVLIQQKNEPKIFVGLFEVKAKK